MAAEKLICQDKDGGGKKIYRKIKKNLSKNKKIYRKNENHGKYQKLGQGTTTTGETRRACKWGEVGTEQTTRTSSSSFNLSTELQAPITTSVEVKINKNNNKKINELRKHQPIINK